MALLNDTRQDFSDNNLFLQMLLGLLSLSHQFDRVLPDPSRASTVDMPDLPPAPPADDGLHMVLGILSLRRTFLGAMSSMRVASEPPEASEALSRASEEDGDTVPALRELLR